MRALWWPAVVIGAAAWTSGGVRADEPPLPAPQAVIDRAIQAAGGPARLSKFAVFTRKGQGKFHGLDQGIPFTGEWTVRLPEQVRESVQSESNGRKFHFVKVLSGDKGWMRLNDLVEDLDRDTLAEDKEQTYAAWVATLLPLKDKEFALVLLGEARVTGRPAWGIKVTRAGHRDVALFFDKEKNWLVKSETQVRAGPSKLVVQEVLYDEYKEAGGIVRPHRTVLRRDGKLFVEMEVTELKPLEKADEKTFARP
jgi:hypothetical protein